MSATARPPARRRAAERLSRTSRFAAIATALMAGSVTGELVRGGAHGYGVVLVGALALGAFAAAARMWHCNCFESRLAVLVLAGLIVAGQVMVAIVGRPGTGTVSWTADSTLVVLFSFLAVALVVADARERPARPEHPYAL